MHSQTYSFLSVSLLLNSVTLTHGYAQVTAAAQLAPRQTNSDPAFVGYISKNGGYSDARSCSYPQTVSTSGSYVQCCPTTGSCPFFTTCSGNTLLAAGATVDCFVNSALTCNTGIVEATPGANGGPSYLACWQKTLGSAPFTFVQNVGSAAATATGSGTTSTGTAVVSGTAASSSAASKTSAAGTSASGTTSGATSSSSNVANAVVGDLGLGGAVGIMAGLLGLL